MNHRSRPFRRLLVAFLGLLTLMAGTPLAAQPRGADALQRSFAAAAREFEVPPSVLLALSYNLSRWEHHGGRPSTTGGYSVMHLVDVDDAAVADRKGHGGARRAATGVDPDQQTLDAAARLLGVAPAVLKSDAHQNIWGGTALLASFGRVEGVMPTTTGDWYAAVARFSGASSAVAARSFADDVFATITEGVERTTRDGQHVRLAAEVVRPNRDSVPVPPTVSAPRAEAECPPELTCSLVPAAYQRTDPNDPSAWGNYDLAQREEDGLDIDYVVIHDTEAPYDATIRFFQDPTSSVSAHYVVRASDGEITQMVLNKDVSYTAGNYYINTHAINLEHEGYALEGATWYSEQMYAASARLVRYLADRYDIPLDRAHIVGHDDVPAPIPSRQAGMHWDPGPFWDWEHYMDLLGAPLHADGDDASDVVTIAPRFATNQLPFEDAPTQSASFVYLRTEPSADAPLIRDAALPDAGKMRASYWGSKAATGQQYVVAERQDDWTAIYFGGQKAWFSDPTSAQVTLPARELVVRPRAGLASIPVYGRAYPEAAAYPEGIPAQELVPMQYAIPAGHAYVTSGLVDSDYYFAPTFTEDPSTYTVVEGDEQYYRIFFNHRFAFVRASDVEVVGPYRTSLPLVRR